MWKPYVGLDGKDGRRPWLMRSFDLVKFHVVEEDELARTLEGFKSGLYELDIRETMFDMKEHSTFENEHAEEANIFLEKQTRAMAAMETEDKRITAEWEKERKEALAEEAQNAAVGGGNPNEAHGEAITSPMTANVWKVLVKQGDVIKDDTTVVTILEAMKTEIPVIAEGYAGKKVAAVAAKPGQAINAGEPLVVIAMDG